MSYWLASWWRRMEGSQHYLCEGIPYNDLTLLRFENSCPSTPKCSLPFLSSLIKTRRVNKNVLYTHCWIQNQLLFSVASNTDPIRMQMPYVPLLWLWYNLGRFALVYFSSFNKTEPEIQGLEDRLELIHNEILGHSLSFLSVDLRGGQPNTNISSAMCCKWKARSKPLLTAIDNWFADTLSRRSSANRDRAMGLSARTAWQILYVCTSRSSEYRRRVWYKQLRYIWANLAWGVS